MPAFFYITGIRSQDFSFQRIFNRRLLRLIIAHFGYFGRRRGEAQIDMFFHSNLATQERSFFGGKRGYDHIAPYPPGSTDFQLFGGNIAAYQACHDDGISTNTLARQAAGFADHKQAAQGHVAIKRAFDAYPTAAAKLPFPVNSRTQDRSNPLGGSRGSSDRCRCGRRSTAKHGGKCFYSGNWALRHSGMPTILYPESTWTISPVTCLDMGEHR